MHNGSTKVYVGVMAQEVQQLMPAAVMRGRDGYLRVDYTLLGSNFYLPSMGHIGSTSACLRNASSFVSALSGNYTAFSPLEIAEP